MERFFEKLRPLIRFVVRRSGLVFVVALAFSVAGLFLAKNLAIDTNLANLLPSDYDSVQALEKLRETVGGESELAIGIQSPSFEDNVAFADVLIPAVLAMRGEGYDEPYFGRVEFRKDTRFLEDNALYFATEDELDKLQDFLDATIEDAALEANPLFFDLDDDGLGEESDTDSLGQELDTIYKDIVSTEYPVSDDSTTLVVRFYPSGSQTDFEFIESAYDDLDVLIESLGPAGYHPEMSVTTAGRLLRQLIEVTTIRDDVIGSFGSGVTAVLLLVVFYFLFKSSQARSGGRFNPRLILSLLLRAPALAGLVGIPLLMSLSWTFGAASLIYGSLNLMTSALGLVLFGLGIDYGIHFFARYSEERGRGLDIADAIEVTFMSTGQAVVVGALTTAAAMYVLVVADFQGFSQFGAIAGTGIINALIAMLLILPSMLVLFERTGILRLKQQTETKRSAPSNRIFPARRPILIGGIVAIVAAIVFLPRVSFEYRFSELEPTYEEYNDRSAVIRKVRGRSSGRNPAYIVVDTREEIDPLVQAIKLVISSDTTSPTISKVESLQERFPLSADRQQDRLYRLEDIRDQLSDPFIEADSSDDIRRLRRAASTREVIELENVPEFLRRQFTSKTGDVGNFVMIYPSVGLSDGRASIAFSDDVGTIVTADGSTYHAGSTSLVAADMLRLMQKESPWMIAATFLIVCLLMYLNFRSVKWTLMALIPLVVGILWMLFLVELTGLKINFYNLIVFPAVLGIGNDAGVHLVHRYREEGVGSILSTIRSTGEHVVMGSVTTMVGFGGLLLSFHPALHSIGQLAVIGIGATLLAAILFLPAMLQEQES